MQNALNLKTKQGSIGRHMSKLSIIERVFSSLCTTLEMYFVPRYDSSNREDNSNEEETNDDLCQQQQQQQQ